MAKSDGAGRSSPAHLTLLVIIGGILLVSPASGASNQETTAEPSIVTFTFEGEFMFLAEMEYEVFDSNQNSVLRVNQDENTEDHQLVLAPGVYNVEARANAGPFSIGMQSLEFDSQEYSHVTLTVQYVLVTEVVSVLALVLLARSLLRVTRRLFGRPRGELQGQQKPTPISTNAHSGSTNESIPEQEPVDDPYYTGAPGDRELFVKYGLEWIKTPEEEKILRELWELENERRKKRGSILISWLVWKEMRRQDEEEVEKGNQEVAERLAADEEERLRQNWLKTPEGKESSEDAIGHLHTHAQDREREKERREKEREEREEERLRDIRKAKEIRRTLIERKKDLDKKIDDLKKKIKRLEEDADYLEKTHDPFENTPGKKPVSWIVGFLQALAGGGAGDPVAEAYVMEFDLDLAEERRKKAEKLKKKLQALEMERDRYQNEIDDLTDDRTMA